MICRTTSTDQLFRASLMLIGSVPVAATGLCPGYTMGASTLLAFGKPRSRSNPVGARRMIPSQSCQRSCLAERRFRLPEAYVLGLFHLYFTVYFHKATRCAEKMLTALILRVRDTGCRRQDPRYALAPDHPIIVFINEGTLAQYLRLDDFVFWAAFQQMTGAKDEVIKELATRLIERRLYKAIDVSAILEHRGGEAAVGD